MNNASECFYLAVCECTAKHTESIVWCFLSNRHSAWLSVLWICHLYPQHYVCSWNDCNDTHFNSLDTPTNVTWIRLQGMKGAVWTFGQQHKGLFLCGGCLLLTFWLYCPETLTLLIEKIGFLFLQKKWRSLHLVWLPRKLTSESPTRLLANSHKALTCEEPSYCTYTLSYLSKTSSDQSQVSLCLPHFIWFTCATFLLFPIEGFEFTPGDIQWIHFLISIP